MTKQSVTAKRSGPSTIVYLLLIGIAGFQWFAPSIATGITSHLMFAGSWIAVLVLFWRGTRRPTLASPAAPADTDHQPTARRRFTSVRGTQLLASAAKQLRNPLTGIVSFSEMLNDPSTGSLNEMQTEFFGEIDKCSRSLLSLVNNILDYDKAETGEIVVTPETVSLPDLVRQCVTNCSEHAEQRGVELSMQTDPDVREIKADPIRLQQILANFVTNAIRESPSGGLVRIHARRVDNDVHISVRDTGDGLSEHEIEHLFNPYFHADKPDADINAGLALATAKSLVELHGGTVTIDSAANSGTLLTVRMPRSKDTELFQELEEEQSSPSQAAVDMGVDEELLRELNLLETSTTES